MDCRGGIGVLIDSMVEEIIDDIVTERVSNVHNTLGPSASEYQHEMPFNLTGGYGTPGKGRVSGAIRLG